METEAQRGESLPKVLELVLGFNAPVHVICSLLPLSVSRARSNNDPQRGKVATPRSQSQ